ncbi:PucR family transcriptional regulator [Tsukamurella sp. 1534]|uniref:PucR family transcriptional regulator n=1 Tax=Tsukamurella sp. 1534 TaxID=1151061 RepID=UPI0002F782AC|nr:PucR family transcriptional regulator [Tsukamurella sp. 1534]
MAVTVRWLLAQRSLGLRLRAGEAGVGGAVTFVMTTELADPTPWLSGGEMLLTTGIGIPPDGAGCRDYVQRLAARGVSALGFGVGVSRDSAPSDLIAAADDVGLPLVDVPLPTPFVAVAHTVIDELARRENRSQAAAARAQQRMTRAAVSGGPSATLRELAAGCGGAALLLDRGGRVVLAHPAGAAEESGRAVGDQARAHPASSASAPRGADTVVTQPVRVGDRGYGHLAVVLAREPAPVDHVLIGHANSLLALDFEKPRRLRAVQWRMNAEALRLVLSPGGAAEGVARLVADAADAHGVRALVAIGGTGAADDVVAALRTALDDAGRPAFVVDAAGGVVALLGADDDAVIAEALLARVPRGLRSRLRVGLGSSHPAGAVAEATAAGTLAARSARPGGPLVESAALAGRTLLADDGARDVLAGLDRALLDPLRAHDARHGGALLPALRAFLENNGQWEGAAAAAGAHRHTVRARVAKAEEVLGVDLRSARVRAELLLALLAREDD